MLLWCLVLDDLLLASNAWFKTVGAKESARDWLQQQRHDYALVQPSHYKPCKDTRVLCALDGEQTLVDICIRSSCIQVTRPPRGQRFSGFSELYYTPDSNKSHCIGHRICGNHVA